MNRLKQAWLALTKGLDAIHIPGDAMAATVYLTTYRQFRISAGGNGYFIKRYEYFDGAEAAHATGREVTAEQVIRTAGGDYYAATGALYQINVTKGERRGSR